VTATRIDDRTITRHEAATMGRLRLILPFLAGAGAGAAVALRFRQPARRDVFPPGPGAISPKESRALAERYAVIDVARGDLAVEHATATIEHPELLIDGPAFFPRMLDDFRAATSSIHGNIYGFRPGEIGDEFSEVLQAAARRGVEVRLNTDEVQSGPNLIYRAFWAPMVEAGVQVTSNQGLFLDLDGLVGGDLRFDARLDDFGHFLHEKAFVVDGRIGWIGGMGIEDHFNDGEFSDLMLRFGGEAVSQLQAIILGTFRHQGGPLAADAESLEGWFPKVSRPSGDAIRATVLRNVPGEGFHQNTQAHLQLISGAREQLDIINPYVTEHPVIDGLIDAAERGVRVRLIIPGKPTPVFMAMALRSNYGRLLDAGVTVLEHPVMCHTKVTLADDRVLLGSCNLDARSLWMNFELGIFVEDGAFASQVRHELFEVQAGKSKPVALSEGTDALVDAVVDRFWKLL
jgi:cardiolipin synthase